MLFRSGRGMRAVERAEDMAAAFERCASEALQAFVRERLAPHKVPREIHLVLELPRTGSGKIDRTALRRLTPAGGS